MLNYLLIAVTSITTASANDFSFNDGGVKEVEKINVKYLETQENLVKSNEKQRAVMGSLYQINAKLRKVAQKRDRLYSEIHLVDSNVKTIAKNAADMEERLVVQKVQLIKRLRSIYMLKNKGAMSYIFSTAKTPNDLEQGVKYLQLLSQKDMELISTYRANLMALESRKKNLREQVKSLLSLRKKVKIEEVSLKLSSQRKESLLSKIKKENIKMISKIKKIKSRGRVLVKDHKDYFPGLFDEAFYEKKGTLNWPVEGSVVKSFGVEHDSEYKYSLNHKGVVIGAANQTVKGIMPGVVKFAGEIEGYGNTVVVDHGDNYFSVYSGLQKVEVKKGSEIKEGRSLGSLGLSDRANLYFEIRHYSQALNPQDWLKQKDI